MLANPDAQAIADMDICVGFWSVSAPFALGLAAQVGVLTHLVALATPALGAGGPRAPSARRRGPRCSGAWRPASWWTGSIGASSPA
jgi:hypothetical protein